MVAQDMVCARVILPLPTMLVLDTSVDGILVLSLDASVILDIVDLIALRRSVRLPQILLLFMVLRTDVTALAVVSVITPLVSATVSLDTPVCPVMLSRLLSNY